MRRWGLIGSAVLAALFLTAGATLAAPSITIIGTRSDANGAVVTVAPTKDAQGNNTPPVARLGTYVIASGQGFVAGQPVQAFLVVQNQAFPLAYQDLRTSVTAPQPAPMTDSAGAFANLAFTLPPTGTLTSGTADILISDGTTTASAPVALDAGISTSAGRGDKIAVGVGAGFALVALLFILLLTRGLPVYPASVSTARRARDAGTT